MIAAVGGTRTYTFRPSATGLATLGVCTASGGAGFGLSIYNEDHVLIGSATPSSNCARATVSVTARRAYALSIVALWGHGLYRFAWGMPGTEIIWRVSSKLGAPKSQTFSVPVLRAGPVSLTVCAPAGVRFTLRLAGADGATLARAAPRSRCQSLTYTARSPGLYRLWQTASGHGLWSGTIKMP